MKKKVLHVLSSNKYSGAENVAAYIVKNLGDEYETIYTSPKGPIQESLEEKSIDYIPMDDFSNSEIRKVISQYNPDIIHAHDFTATIKCAMLNLKLPIVSHIHQNPSWLKSINKNSVILRIMSSKIDRIIAVTPSIVSSMKGYKRLKNKITVIENIVDINMVKEKSISSSTEAYDLLFIGRLVDIKDPIRFINISSNLIKSKPDLKIGIIGDGNLKYKCKEMINKLNLQNNIYLKGYLSNPFPILNNSKLLVMTSKSEGLPMTAIEALALGKPVITSDIEGIEKFVDSTCGAVCINNNEYIECINNILKDKELYEQLSTSAKYKARNLFNTKKYKDKIVEVYNGVEKQK